MADFLQTMAEASAARWQRAAAREELAALRARALAAPPAPALKLHPDFDLIAEVKRASPSAGSLAAEVDPAARTAAYVQGGAAAVSVLTEPERFAGSLEDLAAAAAASSAPVMRKDFLVAPYQVYEARAHGAGGVLLIVALLDDVSLDACLRAADACGLFVLLEAFDAADLARAGAVAGGSRLVGVNTRDLRSLAVDPTRLAALAPELPRGAVCVAESGLALPKDAAEARRLGYRAALVGGALMRAEAPGARVADFLRAGREAAQEVRA